ncbi:MAG TPA: glycoside hydrolase family 95 protein [Pyrinomonadaceae bacterium]|nr:glycoside hydrolase family 95 protein [Pyrinomonadaceae bacterium]
MPSERRPRSASVPAVLLLLALVCRAGEAQSAAAQDLLVWFDAPAREFTQSLPLGSGRLGALVYGGVGVERVVLNESSLWSGSPQDADRPDASKYLPEIRRLLLEGRNVEAEKLTYAHFTSRGPGSGHGSGKDVQYGSYQELGRLLLKFDAGKSGVSGYRRELDLSRAVARVTYTQNGTRFTREYFTSAPDEVFVIRLTADRPKAITFDATLERPERFEVGADGAGGLLMTGQLNNGTDGRGMKYAARLRVRHRGGTASAEGKAVSVKGADEVLLFVTAATDYVGFAGRRTPDPLAASSRDMQKAASRSYNQLLNAHFADYRRYFDRVTLKLGPPNPSSSSLPTPARLKAAAGGAGDPGLAALYFQFGRYLLISSSRPGGLPANLQGIWAEGVQAPWNADWHLNVNVQMNYWPAEVANLSELHEPLFALIASLQEPGARTAKAYYDARGWVAHVITNPWGYTSPGEGASWGSTTTGSAWLCQHLWEHYLFTRDREFLRRAYPLMKGSARFYADFLIEEPRHGWLVTAPANSPENAYLLPDGSKANVCMGPTYDMQLLRYLFAATSEAARTLGVDAEFQRELNEKRARLAPSRVARDGRVMEWLEEYGEPEPTHRHVSHLWGLYPGDEITPGRTPQLADAARKTLEARGDVSTGWSLAHKMNLWARLGDGERAHKLLRLLLTPVGWRGEVAGVRFSGGTYENLFDAHPPFQIDGNFGATAGIVEMLLQSHDGTVRLLPALPSAWNDGEIKGLRARGGFELDIVWKEGKLAAAALRSKLGGACRLAYGPNVIELKTRPGGVYKFDGLLRALKGGSVKARKANRG